MHGRDLTGPSLTLETVPAAAFAFEQALDEAARAIGADPLQFRQANVIPDDAYPATGASGIKLEVLNKNTTASIAYIKELPAGQRPDVMWASAPDAFEVLARGVQRAAGPSAGARRTLRRTAARPRARGCTAAAPALKTRR